MSTVMRDSVHPVRLQGNQRLLLRDPARSWVVQSGALAIFAVPIDNGAPAGERRYLFTVEASQALFGMALSDRPGALGMVAVALEPCELAPLCPSFPGWRSLLEGWLLQLAQIEGLPPSSSAEPAPTTQYVSLLRGQRYQPPAGQVAWLQIQQGSACCWGDPNLVVNQDSGVFPVSSPMWLAAIDPLEFFTPTLLDLTALQRGTAQLHAHCLRGIERIAQAENQAAEQRFQARQQLNQAATQRTLRNLVALLQPAAEASSDQTPLLVAAGAIAKAMGTTIQPPMKSENLARVKEPLEAIARASHLRLRRVLLRDRWWQQDGEPILAYTRMDKHPVALLPTGGSHYELFDPIGAALASDAAGAPPSTKLPGRIPVDARLASTLDPVAYVFYQPLPEGALQAIDLLKFALKGRRRDVASILLTGVAATLLGMFVPQATAVLIDRAIPSGDRSLLVQVGLGLLAVAFGTASFQLAQAIASLRIEAMSDAVLQAAVWDRLLKLKTAFFRQYSIGDLNARVSGISAIRRKLSGTTLQTIFAGSFALLNLGLLFYYSPPLATLALGVALVIVGFTTISGAVLVRQQRHLMELEGQLFGTVVQLISGVSKLRIAGGEERAFAYWGQTYTQQLRLILSTQQLEDLVDLFTTVMPALSAVALFWLASRLMAAEGLSVGTFLAFNVAFAIFIGGVSALSLTLTELVGVVPLWQRSLPILTAEPEVDTDKADPGRLTGSLRIDRVTFRYREEGAPILDEVSIAAEPGEFIALVGPSGSGKSTLLRLLLGFEAPSSGAVYYDGQDLAGLDVAAVRRQLGVVLQNGRISAGTIFENIAGGALISLDEAWTAAEQSGLADDVRAMPMQMHTIISEGGGNLSGGQRQRLVIARALALQPRILLLDEATSALDNRTQAIVSASLDRLKVTRIVIAHRLSTIRNADRIYVLEAGRVVQQGTFEQLAQQPGLFAQLIRRQIA